MAVSGTVEIDVGAYAPMPLPLVESDDVLSTAVAPVGIMTRSLTAESQAVGSVTPTETVAVTETVTATRSTTSTVTAEADG